jgi:hypothetical protein
MRALLLVIPLSLVGIATATADMHSCMYDADKAYEACLRWAAENRKPDSDCSNVRSGRVAECRKLWENWGKR